MESVDKMIDILLIILRYIIYFYQLFDVRK